MLRCVVALSFLLPTLVAAQAPPAPVCTVRDDRVGELSGLVATGGGYIAIDDSNDNPKAIKIFFLSKRCGLTRSVSYPTAAHDPEDLARAPDGTLWVADTGDNYTAAVHRATVALWKLAPGAKRPVIYRLTYPDRPHDAEALLLNGDGTPIIVTKELSGEADVFVPSAPLAASTAQGVPLQRVGSVRLPSSQTPNFLGGIGRQVVTGGAVSPDGRHAVLRTYADAWEYDVTDGDVVAALDGEPRQTPLPLEPQGEAVAYTPDGAAFVTVSDLPFGQPSALLRYVPAVRPSPSMPPIRSPSAAADRRAAQHLPSRALPAVGIAVLCLIAIGVAAALLRRALR